MCFLRSLFFYKQTNERQKHLHHSLLHGVINISLRCTYRILIFPNEFAGVFANGRLIIDCFVKFRK